MRVCYQIVCIDAIDVRAAGRRRSAILEKSLRKRVRDLGLNDSDEIRILKAEGISSVDYRYPVVGVFFGADTHSKVALHAVETLCKNGVFILPVAKNGKLFSKHIPLALQPINAAFLDEDDKDLSSISARLLEELRLLRAKRRVFISYKRDESRAVAVQLYHAFDERSFDVFLDTHSIQRGRMFQPMLWDQMGDADLVLLLDTPGAFTSRWVEEEITRAHALGLGIVQVIWPGHSRDLGSYLCDPIYLEPSDFLGPDINSESLINQDRIKHLIARAEEIRARAMAARRNRVVSELCRIAAGFGFKSAEQAAGPVMMRHPARGPIVAFPVVGHPDSNLIQETFDNCKKRKHFRSAERCLVYDPLGMWETKSGHLTWLNDYLPVRTIPVTEVGEWLKRQS